MSRLMSAMDLPLFPTVALVLFLLAFAAIVWRIVRDGRGAEAHGAIPLNDGTPTDQPAPSMGESHG